MVIIAINLDPRSNLEFSLDNHMSMLEVDAFVLEPVGDVTSK